MQSAIPWKCFLLGPHLLSYLLQSVVVKMNE